MRWLHRLYAFVMGYFWLPCPLCGEHFGGHEARGEDALWREYGRGQGVCPRCGEDGTLVQAQKAIAERPHCNICRRFRIADGCMRSGLCEALGMFVQIDFDCMAPASFERMEGGKGFMMRGVGEGALPV